MLPTTAAECRAMKRWYLKIAADFERAAEMPNRPTHSFARSGAFQLQRAAKAARRKAAFYGARAERIQTQRRTS